MKRLFAIENCEVDEPEPVVTSNNEISIEDELNEILINLHEEPIDHDDLKAIKTEFTLFESTGKRTANQQKLYDAL
jgi:hypothetical protein